MAIDDRLGKAQLFEIVVGQERCEGSFPGDVPEFKVDPADVDDIYLMVKKMQRCYHADPTYPVAEYYKESFSKIEDAYLSQNFNAFQESLRRLMEDIDAE